MRTPCTGGNGAGAFCLLVRDALGVLFLAVCIAAAIYGGSFHL